MMGKLIKLIIFCIISYQGCHLVYTNWLYYFATAITCIVKGWVTSQNLKVAKIQHALRCPSWNFDACMYLWCEPMFLKLKSGTNWVMIKLLTDEGIDTRIHGIKLISESEKEPGLNQDLFSSKELIRYTYMCIYQPQFMCWRIIKFLEPTLKDICENHWGEFSFWPWVCRKGYL